MEGRRRGAAWAAIMLACCAAIAGASGCGGDDEPRANRAAEQTANLVQRFAPFVEVAGDEPWRPMSARWFIERSVFLFAEDDGCADRKIAVGHTLPEQQNPRIDWILPKGLGGWSWAAYFRNPYDAKCELDFDLRFSADHLTRPYDPGARVEGIRPGEGFYLDLVDDDRIGPTVPITGDPDGASFTLPVYAEQIDEGDGAVRLTYWMLFGMHGTPGEAGAHEGDWERIDVLLRDDGDRYEPEAVRVVEDGRPRDSAWDAVRKVGGSHPAVRMARATHTPRALGSGESCPFCIPWETWKSLASARKERWYGFGGAWGDVGSTSDTTGPLGPHRFFSRASSAAD